MPSSDIPPTEDAVLGFFPPRLRQWFGPLIAVTLVIAIVGVAVAVSGILSFPASREDPEGMIAIVHGAFRRSVAEHAEDITVPEDVNAAWRVQLGAAHYARSCTACHGAPGFGQNPISLAMRPKPQYLPAVVDTFNDAELFWIVQNGVKFSGMPAWPHPERADEIWSVVAFLRHSNEFNGSEYLNLAFGPPQAGDDSGPGDIPRRRNRFTMHNDGEPPHDEHSYTWPAIGYEDASLGRRAANGCAGCHGVNGAGIDGGMAPNLTIQSPGYIEAALRSFANGTRPSGIMQNIATQLTPDQMSRIAEEMGDGNRASPGTVEASDANLRLGESIARRGIPTRQVAACASCHGEEGASTVGFPRLAGQNATYLEQQMLLFNGGHRGSTDGYNPMNGIGHRLDGREVAAVAAYYASLAPGRHPAPVRSTAPTAPAAAR